MFFDCLIETPWVNPYRSLGKPPGNGGLSFWRLSERTQEFGNSAQEIELAILAGEFRRLTLLTCSHIFQWT